jgi:hypothetical protein
VNEHEFASKLAGHLCVAAHAVDDGVAQRLRGARERALAVQRRRGRLAWLVAGGGLRFAFGPALRSAVTVVAVLALVLAGDYWSTWSRVASLEEVDTALLIDDLPIDAYLDTEFKTWLSRESQS